MKAEWGRNAGIVAPHNAPARAKIESIPGSGIMPMIVLHGANDPTRHGLDIKDGLLWYRGINKGWLCRLT
jgi:hypothetical protein